MSLAERRAFSFSKSRPQSLSLCSSTHGAAQSMDPSPDEMVPLTLDESLITSLPDLNAPPKTFRPNMITQQIQTKSMEKVSGTDGTYKIDKMRLRYHQWSFFCSFSSQDRWNQNYDHFFHPKTVPDIMIYVHICWCILNFLGVIWQVRKLKKQLKRAMTYQDSTAGGTGSYSNSDSEPESSPLVVTRPTSDTNSPFEVGLNRFNPHKHDRMHPEDEGATSHTKPHCDEERESNV